MEKSPQTVEELRDIFLQGLGKRLGLNTLDLRIGLVVAQKHIRKGEYPEAFRLFSALVLCDPNQIDFQLGLADCALRLGEANFALQAASAAIAMFPRDPRGYLLSGQACFMLGHLIEAEEDFTDAIKFAQPTGGDKIILKASTFLDLIKTKKRNGNTSS